MRINPNPSIEQIGLRQFLAERRDKHNGRDYNDLVRLHELGVPKKKIAEHFGVSWPTVQKWLTILEKQLGK